MQMGKNIVGLKGWDYSREQGAPGAEDRFRDEASALGGKSGTLPGVWFLIWGRGSWSASA